MNIQINTTLFIFIILTLIPFLLFGTVDAYIDFERSKIDESEYWRLFTGHLVHFNLPHLATNIFFILFVGVFIGNKISNTVLGILIVIVMLSIGAFIYFIQITEDYYYGISGVNYALALFGALALPKKNYILKIFLILMSFLAFRHFVDFIIIPIDQDQVVASHLTHYLSQGIAIFAFCIYFFFNKKQHTVTGYASEKMKDKSYSGDNRDNRYIKELDLHTDTDLGKAVVGEKRLSE